MILDTSFRIDVLRGDETVTGWEREIDDRGGSTGTAISVMELWEGIQLTDASENERDRVESLLEGINNTPFEREDAMTAGEINAALTIEGEQIDIEDVMTGTIALERGEPVLTANARHFERIPGLDVRTY